jgi:hypothetical protein
MTKSLWIAIVSALLTCAPGYAAEKKSPKKKVETGASCKTPAVGRCAACNITCQPGETATCAPGHAVPDACHVQPSCRCSSAR